MNLFPNLPIVLYQMIPFVVLIVALKALVFDPMLAYLEERRRRIHGFSADARDLVSKADAEEKSLATRLSEAHRSIADARSAAITRAQDEERQMLTEVRGRLEADATRFRSELSETQRAASAALRTEVERMADEITVRLLGQGGQS